MFRQMTVIGFSLAIAVLAVRVEAAPVPRDEKPSRPLRVLLFASSATREYQFLRSLLVHESETKRVELSIHLQPPGKEKRPGVVQDVPKERLLDTFPTRLDGYDAIVAFDPDWTRLTPEAQTALQDWVRKTGGGLVLIAGPVNTIQLARPAQQGKLAPIVDLYPVMPLDPRLLETDIDTSKPRRLTFPKTNAKYPFLKLDRKGKGGLAGWQEFFSEAKDAKKDSEPRHGFFSYYPIDSVKSDAVVLAALADAKARRKDGKDQPYLVARQVDKGRVMYVGSGELWRLRPYRRAYYETFWLALLAYVAEPRP